VTLIIGTVLEGAALLVTDGRTTLPFSGDTLVADNTPKISAVGKEFAAAQMGITIASEEAYHRFQLMHATGDLHGVAPGGVANLLMECVNRAWDGLIPRLADPLPILPHLRVGLIAAGFTRGFPFVAGYLRGQAPPPSPVLLDSPLHFLLVGGAPETETWAQAEYTRRLSRLVGWGVARGHSMGAPDLRVRVVRVGAALIREAARRDPTIGGQVRYGCAASDGVTVADAPDPA
jgi:hypothetical protein